MSYTRRSENDPDASTRGNSATTGQGTASEANTNRDRVSCFEGVRQTIKSTTGQDSRQNTAYQIEDKTDIALDAAGISETRQAIARGAFQAVVVGCLFPCDACGDGKLGWFCGGCGV